MFSIKRALIFLSVLSIVLGAVGFSAQPAQAAACKQYHTVQRGEYLVKIAGYYGVSWRWLAEINGIGAPYTIYPGQQLCVRTDGSVPPPPPAPPPGYTGFPTFSIVGVQPNKNVTIQTKNLPANDVFNVTMGPMGSKGINGIKVASVESGSGGSKQFTFTIPSQLYGHYQIALRMQSPRSGYFAYNWFYNDTGGTGGKPPPPPPPGYTGFPTFFITGVVRNKSVTVQAYNLPPNDNMVVTMGPMGSRGINGIQVATVKTKGGGNQAFTFTTPPALYNSYQIAVRMQSPTTGYFAYNWFYNNTFP